MHHARGYDVGTERAAERLAGTYSTDVRYTPQAIREVLEYATSFLSDRNPRALDVGAGTGTPTQALDRLGRSSDLVAADLSLPMLQRVWKNCPTARLVAADAAGLPFRDRTFHLTMTILAFHLVDDKVRVLREFSRVTRRGGLVAIVMYEQADLASQIFHQHFASFSALDRPRHPSLETLRSMGDRANLLFIGRHRAEFRITFPSKARLIEFVEQKPFFSLQQMPQAQFEEGFTRFRRTVTEDLADDELISRSALTAAIFRVG
jgi:ubiquinone/menaquinone biosynthesis C-methylase UbiE